MSELSSNPRARASTFYRQKVLSPLEVTQSCPALGAGEHIDTHKDRLYGMLAVLCNKALFDSLTLREKRGPHGLLAPGLRRMDVIPAKRHLHRSLNATLEYDAGNVRDELADISSECDRYLGHLHAMADPTMHPTMRHMMQGGIYTATEAMDMTYTTLAGESFSLTDEDLKLSWRTVYEQTKLGIKELIVLPVASAFEDTREAVFEVGESNVASFCVDGLRSTDSLQNIPDRTTIGCPISFEPALVRELWHWYVDLRAQVQQD